MTFTMEHYNDPYFVPDTEILLRIGKKIRTIRLNSGITQAELQGITGVHKKTIGDAESGKNVTMMNFIAILRGLRAFDLLDGMFRDEGISPVLMAKYSGKAPQRARGRM
jgi:transcriptional regulator with XRE-family HTH domain